MVSAFVNEETEKDKKFVIIKKEKIFHKWLQINEEIDLYRLKLSTTNFPFILYKIKEFLNNLLRMSQRNPGNSSLTFSI